MFLSPEFQQQSNKDGKQWAVFALAVFFALGAVLGSVWDIIVHFRFQKQLREWVESHQGWAMESGYFSWIVVRSAEIRAGAGAEWEDLND